MSDLEERLRFYFNALNAFDLKSVEAMFAEDAVYASSGLGAPIKGRSEIMKAFHLYFAEFDDQVSVDENIELVSPRIYHSNWKLTATNNKTGIRVNRAGTQITEFNAAAMIAKIVVSDSA